MTKRYKLPKITKVTFKQDIEGKSFYGWEYEVDFEDGTFLNAGLFRTLPEAIEEASYSHYIRNARKAKY